MYFPPLCSYYYHQPTTTTTTTTGSGMKECDVVDPTGFGYYKGNKEVYVASLSLSLLHCEHCSPSTAFTTACTGTDQHPQTIGDCMNMLNIVLLPTLVCSNVFCSGCFLQWMFLQWIELTRTPPTTQTPPTFFSFVAAQVWLFTSPRRWQRFDAGATAKGQGACMDHRWIGGGGVPHHDL